MNMQTTLEPTRAQPFRFTVDQFIALCEQGLFDEYSKSELIEGEIVCVNSQWSPHARVKSELAFELGLKLREFGSALRPQVEVSIRLSDSLPEPDIVLTDYRGAGAVPLDKVALVVEVSDTTLDYDLGRKAKLYAAANIPEYWVADLIGARLHRHSVPGSEGYAQIDEFAFGETVVSGTLEGLSVSTASLGD